MARKGSYTTEVRRVDTATPEGATADHTAYEYQLGATIDGVFVPFVTKSGGYTDHLVASGAAATKSNGTDTDDDGDGGA
jgi:hypothetical protein